MRPNYPPYQSGSSPYPPAGHYPPTGYPSAYNADFDWGFMVGRHVGYREGLEAGIRLLQQEMRLSQYQSPLAFTHQGAGMPFPARMTTPVAPMPPFMGSVPPFSHSTASPFMPMPRDTTFVRTGSPFVCGDDYRRTATASCQAQASHESTSVTASGYPGGPSRRSDTPTRAIRPASAVASFINSPDMSERSSHFSISHLDATDVERERVVPQLYSEPASSPQATNVPSDDELEIDVGS